MKFTQRAKQLKIKKSRKRLRLAIVFVIILLVIPLLGFLARFAREESLIFFQQDKLLKPVADGGAEKKIAEEFKKTDLKLISLSIVENEDIMASLSGEIKVIFKNENIEQQVSSLQLMLSRFKIEGRIPKKIDLRFEKPIVVF